MNEENQTPDNWRARTNMVRGGTVRSDFGETSEGLFMTSGYIYPSAESAERAFKGDEDRFIYSRFSNPTVAMFEQRMALVEGAVYCRAAATGMAAVFTALACLLKAGDRLVASKALFGSCDYVCTEVLPRFGIETIMVEGTNLDAWEQALAKPAGAVFLESPSNPGIDVIDIAAVSELAHAAGARVVVDNVFATPILQKPLELGADIAVYSATKHIDGQGRAMGGAIVSNDEEYLEDNLRMFIRHTGPALSPFNAWVLLKGLETLELRVGQHCANAHIIAAFLDGRAEIKRIVFPGLPSHPQYELAQRQMSDAGGLITFELDGDKQRTFRFLNALRMIDISNNLGDTKSLVTHPATTTHQRISEEGRAELGITDGVVRLSVGLEDPQDVMEDLAQALES